MMYTFAHTLKRHISQHHPGEKLYKCQYCHEIFQYSTLLKAHKVQQHGFTAGKMQM